MSALRQILEGIGFYRLLGTQTLGAATTVGNAADTWASGMGIHENAVVLVDVGAVGTSITLTIQHSNDNTTWANLSTLTAITAAGYYVSNPQLTAFRRYVRMSAVTVGQANLFSVQLIGDRCRREPIVQTATAI